MERNTFLKQFNLYPSKFIFHTSSHETQGFPDNCDTHFFQHRQWIAYICWRKKNTHFLCFGYLCLKVISVDKQEFAWYENWPWMVLTVYLNPWTFCLMLLLEASMNGFDQRNHIFDWITILALFPLSQKEWRCARNNRQWNWYHFFSLALHVRWLVPIQCFQPIGF
jgi:hypothetical protein